MTEGAQTRRVARLGEALCLVGAALGLVALLGWLTGIHLLTYLVKGRPPMVPNTAVGLLLLGLGVAVRRQGRSVWRAVSVGAGAAAGAIGALTLAEYALGRDFGIDELVIRTDLPPHPGRPSPPTALALVLLSAGLIIFDGRPRRGGRPAEWLILPAALIGLVTIVAHAHGAVPVYQWLRGSVIGVSVPTSLAILLISAGMLLLLPEDGLMGLATAPGPGGVLLRRLGLSAVLAPPLIGLAASHFVSLTGYRDVSLALALLTTSMVPFGVFVVIVTATRLERTHHALVFKQERLRALVEQASEGIFMADLEGRYQDVNAAGCQLLGCSREEIVGKTIVDFIPPDDVPRLWEDRDQLMRGGHRVGEWHLLRKDGTRVPVEVSASILPDGRWQGLVRDISERKAVEKEAAHSRARLDGIISISSDAIISIDGQQRIVLYNRGAQQIFGWSRDEVMGRSIDVLIPERLREVHRAHVARFAAEPIPARKMGDRRTLTGLRRNGQEFPADASISKVEIEGQWFLTVVLRDVTERVALEGELREARDFLQNVLQSSVGYSIVALDRDRRVVLWNEGARRNHGYDSAEVLGRPVELLHAPDDLASGEAQSIYAAALDRGVAEEALTLARKDGSTFVAQVLVARRQGLGDDPIGYLLVARDISHEQRQAEHERLLAEAGEALASTLDADAIIDQFARLVLGRLADACLVELADGTARRVVQHRDPAKAAVVRALQSVAVDRSRPHLAWAALERRRAVLVSHVTSDYLATIAQSPQHRRLLESLEMVSYMAIPIVHREAMLGSVVFVASTRGRYESADLARAEELVRRLALALDNASLYGTARQAIARRDEVLGIVAHDLRNPLAAARLGAETLLARPAAEDRRKLPRQVAERMVRSLDRADRLIGDLLDVSRIDAGRLTVEPAAVPVERLAHDAADLIGPAMAAARLTLTVEVEPGLPPVWADAGRILQVLSNLLGNTVKFVPAGGHVRLAVARHQDLVRFSVSDDGPGIAGENLAHLFDRFWQAKSSDRRGAGLGLAIAKGIVEAHGGEIWGESQPGTGSTFSFVLRVAAEERAGLLAGAAASH